MKLNDAYYQLIKKKYDVVICEVGGTVGDIEGLPFYEAIRQLRLDIEQNSVIVHTTLLPFINAAGEIKISHAA